jgi:hypothetical protein
MLLNISAIYVFAMYACTKLRYIPLLVCQPSMHVGYVYVCNKQVYSYVSMSAINGCVLCMCVTK